MAGDTPTRHQLETIVSVDRHVLVAAGAGSGKTATVIQRLLYLLGAPVAGKVIAEPVPLERIAAITFTLTAAAQLKRKLRAGLREAGLADLAWRVDTARLGTIHGFCGEILREFALKRNTSPRVEVLEEGEAAGLKDQAARDALVAAVEEKEAGVHAMLARRQQDAVHAALVQLLEQGDRLRRIAASELPADEAALMRVALRAQALLEARLAERGAVDFDRMLTWTRDLVRDDDYARRTLQRRIHTLVIDEFQDVDPVQWEIARLLGDPASARPDTPRLLLVGDPKQSIYRFRHADVTTWRAAEELFRGGAGKVIPLNENFRSTAPILDFVAATVGTLLDTPLDQETMERQPFEIEFARLEPGTARQADGPPVELLVVPPIEGKIDDVRAMEAEAIARRAVELHAEGVAWKEMALLMPAWSAAEIFQPALRRHGVPTYLLTDEGFYQRREVVDQIVALEAVRDPYDDRALMGFLRSPFVGVRDETLLAIALGGGRPYWPRLRDQGVECAEADLLAHGVALLRRAVSLRDRVPNDVLLSDLLERSGYWAHLALLGEEKAQAIANVRKFLFQTRAAAESTLGDYLRGIAAERDRGDRVGDARLYGETDDVVTLSTIHSAKGLQWRVVFWCDLERDAKGRSPKVLVGRDSIALRDPLAKKAEDQPAHWQALQAEIALEEAAERKRVWYVAATRAAERLIVSAFPEPSKLRGEPPAKVLDELLGVTSADDELAYPRHGGGMWTATVRTAEHAVAAEPSAAPSRPVPPITAYYRPLPPITPSRRLHSATEALTHSRCPKKHWFQYIMGLREPAVGRGGPDFGSAVARGQIVHDVLEQYRLEAELDGLIDDAVRKWDPDAPAPETPEGSGYRARLRKEIESVAQHPAWREVADLPGARRELGFVHLTGPERGWQGAIDLAGQGPDGLILLDVKTGGAAGKDLELKARQYGPQRQVYVDAAESVSGTRVAEFRFLFSGAGVSLRHPVEPSGPGGHREEVLRLAADIEVAAGTLTQFDAECGFCGYRRVEWCPGCGQAGEAR